MRITAAVGLLLLASLGSACRGNSEPSGPSNAEITGTWTATSWKYVAVGGGASVDLMTNGETATLILQSGGSGSLSRTPAGSAPVVSNFTWTRDNSFISFIYGPSQDDNFRVALTSGTLTLSLNGATKSYDVNGDGTGEATNWSMAFTR